MFVLQHEEFYSKNKFEKLVHLFGFVIRMYHDARSPECQMQKTIYRKKRKLCISGEFGWFSVITIVQQCTVQTT